MLGAFGVANMWKAVFADVGVALLAILNAMRVRTYSLPHIGNDDVVQVLADFNGSSAR